MATGLRIMAAIAKKMGHDVHIIILHGYEVEAISEAVPENSSATLTCVGGQIRARSIDITQTTPNEWDLFRKALTDFKPNLLGFSSRSNMDLHMLRVMHEARVACPRTPIVCGGHGPTYNPLHYLKGGADMAVRGEGEGTWAEIIAALEQGINWRCIRNVCYLQNGKLSCNSLRPQLTNLDDVPPPLTGDNFVSFIENDRLEKRDPAFADAQFSIWRGRGCIGTCSYCAAPVWERMYRAEGHKFAKYRKRKTEAIFQELETAQQHGIQRVYFIDDYFVDYPGNLIRFFQEYKSRIGLPFKAHLHSEQLVRRPDVLQAALDAGFESYSIGFQSSMENISRTVYGRPHPFTNFLALAYSLFNDFVTVQYHFISGTSLNDKYEQAEKFRLIAQLPFDPAIPGRTLLFDFRFFPQKGSTLMKNYPDLRREPAYEWARKAMLCQLRFVGGDLFLQDQLESNAAKDDWKTLQSRYATLLRERQEAHYRCLGQRLAGQDAIFLGVHTNHFAARKNLFTETRCRGVLINPLSAVKVSGYTNLIAPLCRADELDDSNIPVLLFHDNALKIARALRQTGLRNPLYAVRQHAQEVLPR
jgi:hypothetical protein